MPRRTREISLLVLLDLVLINVAWSLYFWFRVRSGITSLVTEPDYWIPMIAVSGYWLLLFFVFGLYRSWYAKSRLDELVLITKAIIFGVLLLFFLIFFDDRGGVSAIHTRFLILVYCALMILCVGAGRMLQHTFQRRLLIAGVGLRNTIIVGGEAKALALYDELRQYPALGYRVIGFVTAPDARGIATSVGVPVLGTTAELASIIERCDVRDVLIALDSTEHDRLLAVLSSCSPYDVSIKIIPDLYDIISGQARTNQIYGFPLIEIMPELMQPWEEAVKRTMDIAVSSLILIAGLPLWILVAIAIKVDSRGPVFYTQERVGKDEKPFKIIKFRSMDAEAEKHSGPVWANKQDPRITRVGKILRKTRIDEIPQFINVLDGDMSLVGPRPERSFFVEQLSKEIPLYRRRLKVRPGITGWAQVKHKYDESIDDVRKKVEYDLYYIENMSIRMDLKILLNTIAVVLLGKGH